MLAMFYHVFQQLSHFKENAHNNEQEIFLAKV